MQGMAACGTLCPPGSTMMLGLFIASALFYGAASFAYGTDRTGDRVREETRPLGFERFGRLALALGTLFHFLAIGAQCVQGDHPLKNIFLATSFATWAAVCGYLPLAGRLGPLGAVMAPVGLVGLALGVV